ncbi:probable protein-translocating porin PorT [bacterium A37T11]|nr:probable protein-translocating porin PorT [bacterium A37T11]
MKRTAVFLFFVAIVMPYKGNCQRWGGGVDNQPLHFGFLFQYVYAGYKMGLNGNWQNSQLGRLKSITAPVSGGWGLGLLADAKIQEHVNLRFTPTLIFSNRRVHYEFADTTYIKGNDETLLGESNFLKSPIFDLPLTLKLSSDRRRDYKIYMLGGAKYSFEVISQTEDKQEIANPGSMALISKRGYFSFEAGLGVELFLQYFKLTPEIKFSQSFHNMLGNSVHGANNPFQTPIDKLFLRSFQFSLFFE